MGLWNYFDDDLSHYTTQRPFNFMIDFIYIKYTVMNFKIALLLTTLLLSPTLGLNYCEVENSEVTLFTTQNEIQQISLDKFIKGYDLDFTSSNETVVSVFEPYHVIEKADVTIKAGYSIVNVDGKNSNTRLWGRQGIVFAQGGERNVSFGYGEFANGVLPKIEGYNYYELPYVSNCYSGLIYNENLDTVIDCEKTTANPDEQTDLVCLTFRSGTLHCRSFPSITKTSKRKSVVLTLNSQKFLLSATLTDHISSKFQNETFLTVYHLGQDSLQFNYIIDRRTLGLPGLSITDIDIVEFGGSQHVVLSDLNAGLVVFRYTEDNGIDQVKVLGVQGMVRQFAVSAEGTWLIATEKYVLDCELSADASSLNVLRKYELDPTDSQVTDLQSSYLFLSVRTSLGHLYTYSRKHTQLKYLLNRQDITENTAVAVSPFYPRILQINNTAMVSIAISSGYLYVSQVEKSTDVLILGHSGSTTCVFEIRIELVKDMSKIYQKKVLTSAYRLETNQPLRFVLTDYFGGSNLKYNVSSPQKIQVTKEHINHFTQELPKSPTDPETLFTKVIEIDDKSYYLAKFTTDYVAFYKCELEAKKVTCKEIDARIDPKGRRFAYADGIQRQDGKAYISWTYGNNDPQICVKEFGMKGYSMMMNGNVKRYSQALVAEKFMAYVEKELGTLTFFNTNVEMPQLITFTKSSFTQAQLASMGGGFYPRQIIDSHNNPHVFYLKFPVAVVAINYMGGKDIEVLSYNKVSNTYIADDLWEIVVGRQTMLLFVGDSISEYAILADGNLQKLHGIFIGKRPVFPVRYELETDTAYFECEDGTIQYLRLNQPALDSAYYSLELKKGNSPNDWDVSGPWLVSSSGEVFYQFEEPALVIYSTLPDTTYREDLTMSITVSSETEKKEVQAKVTAFNYPVKIQVSSSEDNGLVLPEKGDNQIIPFPIDKYFTGSVANYRIVCPYCLDGTLTLVLPIRIIKQNKDLNGYTAIVGLEDNTGSVVLLKNEILIVDLANTVVVKKEIQVEGECTSLGINEGNLVVFCGGAGNQHLFLYQVTKSSIEFSKSYIVPGEALLFKPSEMGIYKSGNAMTVFIHDVDLMNPSARDSNVKVFALGDTIEFKGNLDSSAFQIANSDPVNSMSIKKDAMLVAIGGKGLGYLNLAKSQTKGSFVDLENEPALKEFTLDDTAYLRVTIYTKTEDTLTALVTTSNTFSYLLQFKVSADGKIKFSALLETYRRYGHQRCLNWGLIDDSFVMLSFFNTNTSVETLALYKRNQKGITDFFTSIQFTIPAEGLRPPKATLLHPNENSYLFRDNTDKPASPGSLNLYNVTHEFGLLATYDKPSSFEIIQVTASNDYYNVTRELNVSFEGQDGGVKWYSIVIVCALVAIAIGVALGFYLKMKRKKADSKKVSLFTENEEVDEEV